MGENKWFVGENDNITSIRNNNNTFRNGFATKIVKNNFPNDSMTLDSFLVAI